MRKTFIGTVVSDANDKTIVVAIETYRKDRLYGKRVKQTAKFHAHDENNAAHVGDTVKIVETRPLSATKHFRLLEILEKKENI